jgi:hypothetical protein
VRNRFSSSVNCEHSPATFGCEGNTPKHPEFCNVDVKDLLFVSHRAIRTTNSR